LIDGEIDIVFSGLIFVKDFLQEEPNGGLEFVGLSCRKNRIGKSVELSCFVHYDLRLIS
jgi:hypothetical protein